MFPDTFSPWGLWRVDPQREPLYAGGHVLVSRDGIETWGFDAVVTESRYAWEIEQPDALELRAQDAWGDEIHLRFEVSPEGDVRLHLLGCDVCPWSLEVPVLRADSQPE